jgi:hypothetical protein
MSKGPSTSFSRRIEWPRIWNGGLLEELRNGRRAGRMELPLEPRLGTGILTDHRRTEPAKCRLHQRICGELPPACQEPSQDAKKLKQPGARDARKRY